MRVVPCSLGRSVVALLDADRGFDTASVLTLDSEIPGTDGENPPPFRVVGVVDNMGSADGTPVGGEMFVAQPQWREGRIGGDPVLAPRPAVMLRITRSGR